jgi:hypothetical protein
MYQKLITIQTPTRKRLESFIRTMKSIDETVTDPDRIEMIAFVHEDDTETMEWLKNPTWQPRYDVRPMIGLPSTRGYRFNPSWYANMSMEGKGQWNIWMADDIVVDTVGWDELLVPFDGQFGIICPHCDEDVGFNVQPIYSRSLFDVMKWFGTHPYIDRWLGGYTLDVFPELLLGRIKMETRHVKDNPPSQSLEENPPCIEPSLNAEESAQWHEIHARILNELVNQGKRIPPVIIL